MRWSRLLKLTLAVSALSVVALMPMLVFAQGSPPAGLPDWHKTLAEAITAFAPLLIPFVVYGVRKVFDRIPRVALPVLALGLGLLVSGLASYIDSQPWSPITGAALGAASVFLREVYNTAKQHGINP